MSASVLDSPTLRLTISSAPDAPWVMTTSRLVMDQSSAVK